MAAATGAAFTQQLNDSDLPAEIAGQLGQYGSTAVAGGVPPIPEGADAQLAATITDFTNTAFLTGMQTTMLIAAAIAAAGAIVALVVRGRPAHPADADAYEAEHPYVTE